MPKYLNDISMWFENLFRIRCNSIIHTSNNLESLLLIIRYVQRATNQEINDSMKKGIIYLPADFDLLLKNDLLSLLPNIQFEHCKSHSQFQDVIDINQLEKLLENHPHQTETYPMMIIAQAGNLNTSNYVALHFSCLFFFSFSISLRHCCIWSFRCIDQVKTAV